MSDIDHLILEVRDELVAAIKLHMPQHSPHESYAVILEELEEFWDEVKKNRENRDRAAMRKELIQTAAMCVGAIHDLKL